MWFLWIQEMLPDCLPKLTARMSIAAFLSSALCGWVNSSEEKRYHLEWRAQLCGQSAGQRVDSWLCRKLDVDLVLFFVVCNDSCLQYSLLDFSKLQVIAFFAICSCQAKQKRCMHSKMVINFQHQQSEMNQRWPLQCSRAFTTSSMLSQTSVCVLIKGVIL